MASYLLYAIAVCSLAIVTGLFLTRNRWFNTLVVPDYIYSRLPSSFQADIEEGFTSRTFDLDENLVAGDTRPGLDNVAKREIRRIMRTRNLAFDEARRVYTEERFERHGIGADGRPRDPKFVSFS